MKITLTSYEPWAGYGCFKATTEDGNSIVVDLHTDGTVEPFSEWVKNPEIGEYQAGLLCRAMIGKVVDIEVLRPLIYYGQNGKML